MNGASDTLCLTVEDPLTLGRCQVFRPTPDGTLQNVGRSNAWGQSHTHTDTLRQVNMRNRLCKAILSAVMSKGDRDCDGTCKAVRVTVTVTASVRL